MNKTNSSDLSGLENLTGLNKTATPKLRFPEFQDSPAWEGKLLEQVVKSVTTGKLDANAMVENGAYRFYTCAKNYYQIDKYAFEGEALLIAGNGAYLGYIHHYNGKFNAYQRTYVLQDFDANALFIKYFLDVHLPARISIEKKDGNTPYIVMATITELPIAVPSSLEQQKIADCLTSLDDLIAAQSQKVESLKAYKKGLMQNLFPAEGESVPRLRFPEFESAGEWEEINLGDLGTPVLGLTYSPSDIRDKGLLVLRSSNIKDGKIVLDDCVYVAENVRRVNLSKPNDILICVRNGSTALIGKNALIPEGMPLCTHGAFMTVFRSNTPKFVYQLLQTEAYQNQVAAGLGARINSINNSQLVNYKFFVPTLPEEQQRIAELLSAVDEEISAQGEAVAALKVHKKGLMQGLFVK